MNKSFTYLFLYINSFNLQWAEKRFDTKSERRKFAKEMWRTKHRTGEMYKLCKDDHEWEEIPDSRMKNGTGIELKCKYCDEYFEDVKC